MNYNQTQIEQKIFEYIGKNSHTNLSKVNSQTLLFKEGIFDSMGFVLLLDFLEENFVVRANDDDLVEENFESVSAITNYILRKSTVDNAKLV